MPITPVERLEVANVGGISRAKRIVVDRPPRRVFGMAMAVLLDEPVQEFEKVARRAQVTQGVLEVVVADRVVDETAQAWCFSVGARVLPACAGGGRWPDHRGMDRSSAAA